MKYKLLIFWLIITFGLSAKEIHVSVRGNDTNEGTLMKPFRTINHAAQIAVAGDVVIVHAGTYRERINPKNGGENDSNRIIYKAADGEKVEIKGSEVLTGWKKVKEGVWKIVIPNSFFGDYNPFKDYVAGDWCSNPVKIHTCDIFIGGKSLFETDKMELVTNPVPNAKVNEKESTLYTWYTECDDQTTTVWANFQKRNPNKELTEVSIRRTCFYPETPGINYITITGFDFSQAATQWGAPTAEQVGMVATHWNKGWIIENNTIHDSKCVGISLGKERKTGHNVWTQDLGNIFNDGNIHYIEVIFRVLKNGWNKENIGSHIVRNNKIFNCEQAGICGSMGAVFCTIENNHVYNIHQKKQFGGAELGGIKLHAAIDTQIIHNRIHSVDGAGIWLDWMAQGTRVSRNLMYNNSWQDIFAEVNHGPYLIDNNILLSENAINLQSTGGAIVHNLIVGTFELGLNQTRSTPYHLGHSTEIKGLSEIVPGDDRFYNNIFLTKKELKDGSYSLDENFGLNDYKKAKLSATADGNIYYGGSIPYFKEVNFIENRAVDPKFLLIEEGNKVFISYTLADDSGLKTKSVDTDLLGKTTVSKEKFENPDGTPLKIDIDYFGNKRSSINPSSGAFENKGNKIEKLQVW
ncbi:right-handed parallel beta-helix repeat-containing protein [Flavobacterium aquiphilum]|uniref:right-handed parallel beta-helix repeat-containing protein n=1 Tax=Flavobacterium aquiphilum TaxID=3003261 RepID=UPI0024801245|nr:right-handed parallel beta-helix repeat-containing protein [Flavobacterium aquiphilum]